MEVVEEVAVEPDAAILADAEDTCALFFDVAGAAGDVFVAGFPACGQFEERRGKFTAQV